MHPILLIFGMKDILPTDANEKWMRARMSRLLTDESTGFYNAWLYFRLLLFTSRMHATGFYSGRKQERAGMRKAV